MQVSVKPLEKSEVAITVRIPWEEWKKQMDKAAAHLSKEIKLPGFRPGKVPREVIEKKYGKALLASEAADLAVQDSYPEVLRLEKIDAIGRPKAEVKSADEGTDLEYTVTTAIVPKAKLGAWKKGVQKARKKHESEPALVSDEDVRKELDRLAQSRAKLVTVNRAAQDGDAVEVNFRVLRDGVVIENGTGRKHPIVLGSHSFIPGFEEQVIGMSAGEKKEFELSFPEKYHAKDLAGQKALFTVELIVVQERQIPALDDAFAQSLGKFETLDALKSNMREGMAEEKKQQSIEAMRADMAEALAETTEVVLPEVMIEEETHKMIHEFEGQVQSMGMNLDDYLKGMNKTHQDLHRDWEPQAKKRLIISLALDALARELSVEVASEEVEAEMNKTLQYYKGLKDVEHKLDLEKLYAFVKGRMQNEKVFEALMKI